MGGQTSDRQRLIGKLYSEREESKRRKERRERKRETKTEREFCFFRETERKQEWAELASLALATNPVCYGGGALCQVLKGWSHAFWLIVNIAKGEKGGELGKGYKGGSREGELGGRQKGSREGEGSRERRVIKKEVGSVGGAGEERC